MTAPSNRKGGSEGSSQEDDSYYVALCQQGDTDAFQVLVERHQRKTMNIAYRITGDYEEACETTQEAFLSAFRAIRKFRGEAAFSTWLTGITINCARNTLRKMRHQSSREGISLDDPVETVSGPLMYGHPSGEEPLVEQLERQERQAKVQECIGTLEDEFREVLVLRDIQELSYEEIRRILNIPEGTIKSRLFRAREAMKNCLRQVLGDI
jgi:RNA polymerase sigma-70 factor (ECF subfamily)